MTSSGPRIVESRQQGEGPEADETVGVFVHGLKQRRYRLRRGRATNRAAGGHARRVIEVAKLVDCLANLIRGGRRGTALLGEGQ